MYKLMVVTVQVPAGSHALISVSQPLGQLVAIRSQGALPGAPRPAETVVSGDAGRSHAHRLKVRRFGLGKYFRINLMQVQFSWPSLFRYNKISQSKSG